MSESDSEFRDLMVESLAQDGILAKIRAQLRAHIYIALENESKITENISKAFHSDYYAIMFLIYDFLNFYNFEYTLSVFEAESDYSNKKHFNNKADFCKYFNITPEIDSSPMLLEIFQVYKKTFAKTKVLNSTYDLNADSKNIEEISHIKSETFDKTIITDDKNMNSNEDETEYEINTASESYIANKKESDLSQETISNLDIDCNATKLNETHCENQNYISNFSNKNILYENGNINSDLKNMNKIVSSSPHNAANSINLIQFDDSISDISSMKLCESPDKIQNDPGESRSNNSPEQPNKYGLHNQDTRIPSHNSILLNHDISNQKLINSASLPSFYVTATNVSGMKTELDTLNNDDTSGSKDDEKINVEHNKAVLKGKFSIKHSYQPDPESNTMGDGFLEENSDMKMFEQHTNL